MQEVQSEQTEQEPVFDILHAHQTLPPESWEPSGQSAQVFMDELNATIAKAAQEGPGPDTAAWSELKKFPCCTLCDNRDSRRRYKGLNKRLGKFLGGDKLQVPNTKKLSG